jgi:glycosyltransferase involved in cell wall biosynthesis
MYKFRTISVVMPCYNEQEGLNKMLRCKPSFIDEVIIVDNNSTDNTVNIAKRHGATIAYEKKKGYGHACLAGLSKAKGDTVILLDGDATYSMGEIEKLLLYMESNSFDFVNGNRYPLANKKVQPVINQIANWTISLFIRVLFEINLKDSQSGMFAFKNSLLDKIKVYNTGMGFPQEIKIKAFTRRDVRCGEVHIDYGMRLGEVKFRKFKDSVQNVYSLLRLWKELL